MMREFKHSKTGNNGEFQCFLERPLCLETRIKRTITMWKNLEGTKLLIAANVPLAV